MNVSEYSIKNVNLENKKYPSVLRQLQDPPETLYYIGNLKNVDFDKCLAVVGSRRMTSYGRQVIDKFMPDLVASGVTIVSGFMYGVDAYAHSSCVDLGGKTIAVLANGLDICYPPENEKLYKQILESNGVVMSEYPLGRKPHLWTFPRRNRIVAAMSLMGTLVIEAGEKSGSLITARIASKLKRKVYAVPGPITSKVSIGTNYLIQKRKATMVNNVANLVKVEHKTIQDDSIKPTSSLEAKIYQTLTRENCTLDELSAILDIDISTLSTQVSLMSLKGSIEEIGGKLIAKNI